MVIEDLNQNLGKHTWTSGSEWNSVEQNVIREKRKLGLKFANKIQEDRNNGTEMESGSINKEKNLKEEQVINEI